MDGLLSSHGWALVRLDGLTIYGNFAYPSHAFAALFLLPFLFFFSLYEKICSREYLDEEDYSRICYLNEMVLREMIGTRVQRTVLY